MQIRFLLTLVTHEIARVNRIAVRYPLEASVSVATFGIVFAAIYWVVNLANLPLDMFQGGVAPVATRYALWIVLTTAMTTAAYQLMSESTQARALIFSAYSKWQYVLIARHIAYAIQGLVVAVILIAPVLAISKQSVSATALLLILGAIICSLPACAGVGIALCGLAVRFKRIGALLVPLNFALMVVVMTPQQSVERMLHLLPFSSAAYVIASAMSASFSAANAAAHLAYALPGSLVVLVAGLVVGHAFVDSSRASNTL